DFIKNIYFFDENYSFNNDKYLFSLSENFFYHQTFLYIHENSRHFQNKYTRTKFTNFIQNIFAHKRKKEIEKRLNIEKMIAENTPFLLVPSTFVKDDLLEFFNIKEGNICILPPCINKVDEIQKEKNEIFTFGLSARGFGNKGGWQVIISALWLKLLNKKFKILIIYPFTKHLKPVQLIVNILGLSQNIEFLDYCKDIKNEFYSKIDCLIVASKREAFGLVAPEAMQLGIPTIVSTRCGIKDFIKNNENGFVYDYKKPLYNLFKKMLYVLDNKDKLEKISENSKKIYEELTYDKLKNNIKNILEKTNFL
ncbi:MAG: glycosyltransferase family 4 protein, partial [Candidatus Gastranaerophilales bacterium]|nr:glycosyltransferase family 4 protein [Candidatus Gastranaerophilales bacterium]